MNSIIYKFQMSDNQRQNSPAINMKAEANLIASRASTRDYFLDEESKLLDQWGNQSIQLFQFTGEVFKSQYQIKCQQMMNKYGQSYDDLYQKSKKQFEAYCILNRKVQKKGDEIQNFAGLFSNKNQKKTFFSAWKAHSQKAKFIRKMQDIAQKHKVTWILRNCMKSWHNMTMASNRHKIKNEVLHKTQIQISRIQSEYEKLIKTLEENLQKKLLELKKEQEEHKLLHDKYEAMYSRSKIENPAC